VIAKLFAVLYLNMAVVVLLAFGYLKGNDKSTEKVGADTVPFPQIPVAANGIITDIAVTCPSCMYFKETTLISRRIGTVK